MDRNLKSSEFTTCFRQTQVSSSKSVVRHAQLISCQGGKARCEDSASRWLLRLLKVLAGHLDLRPWRVQPQRLDLEW